MDKKRNIIETKSSNIYKSLAIKIYDLLSYQSCVSMINDCKKVCFEDSKVYSKNKDKSKVNLTYRKSKVFNFKNEDLAEQFFSKVKLVLPEILQMENQHFKIHGISDNFEILKYEPGIILLTIIHKNYFFLTFITFR